MHVCRKMREEEKIVFTQKLDHVTGTSFHSLFNSATCCIQATRIYVHDDGGNSTKIRERTQSISSHLKTLRTLYIQSICLSFYDRGKVKMV